ncbi:hypothetical protein LZ480_04510 [Solibacillus sp. MA9]|uniref:Stage II sporulation protein M n=1 Tax=Solibacillus palustris TaxID=2908203 RepID=A0ABS9U9Y6_9BACL|nr:hypothetical protein [Solibacillus sp. MA9]
MRNYLTIQYTSMIVICFICGVLCYQLFEMAQIKQVITIFDQRLLSLEKPTIFWNVVPFLVSIIIVLFFSTHQYLAKIALIFIAIKMTFLGLSSVFLLVQHDSIKMYAYWWFPFQLLYGILLIMLYEVMKRQQSSRALKRTLPYNRVLILLFVFVLIGALENFAITYLFK